MDADPGKKVTLEVYIGNQCNVQFSGTNDMDMVNHCSTVAAPRNRVISGKKVYYEVTFQGKIAERWSADSSIGWASTAFKPYPNHKDWRVGNDAHSWGYSAQFGHTRHCNKDVEWGKILDYGNVIGVALDMEQGRILYSSDGSWESPMGVAFNDIDTSLELFPAISCWNMKVSVNFGEKPFCYDSRPDAGYKKLTEVWS